MLRLWEATECDNIILLDAGDAFLANLIEKPELGRLRQKQSQGVNILAGVATGTVVYQGQPGTG